MGFRPNLLGVLIHQEKKAVKKQAIKNRYIN